MPSANQLDHVALHVAHLDASILFYQEVLCLHRLKRPAFDFPGAWFRIGTHQELHLIGGRDALPASEFATDRVGDNGHRGGHFAMSVDSLDTWEQHFAEKQIAWMGPKRRPDGAEQVFVQDPDGYWIELCCVSGISQTESVG